jgi:hypothetical protein
MKKPHVLVVTGLAFAVAACSSGGSDPEPNTFNVSKATCGANDRPETALQGQVPAALRTVGGFKGFNCNLELASQSRNDGEAGRQPASRIASITTRRSRRPIARISASR